MNEITLTNKEANSLYQAMQDGYASFLNDEAAQLSGECGEHAKAVARYKAGQMLGALRTLGARLLDAEFGHLMGKPV